MDKGISLVPAEVLGTLPAISRGLLRMAEALPLWEEEALVELFRQAQELENAGYATRCLICDVLVRRYGGEGERMPRQALEAAGRALSLAPYTVREMATAWRRIFARLQEDLDLGLPASFYQRALRGERYGVDPVEAVRYAAHRRQVLGEKYTAEAFEDDIRRGLPDPEGQATVQEAVPSCTRCLHWVAAPPGARLFLMKGQETLAEAEAEGTHYCGRYGLLRPALGDLVARAAGCSHYHGGGRRAPDPSRPLPA